MLFLKILILLACLPVIYPIRQANNHIHHTSHHNLHNEIYTHPNSFIQVSNNILSSEKISRWLSSIKQFFDHSYTRLPTHDTTEKKTCNDIFGKKWFDPSPALNQIFNKRHYSLCVMKTHGDGNCLFNAVAAIINFINRTHLLKEPDPSYDAPDDLKDLMRTTIDGTTNPARLKKIAALDFIGVNFNNKHSLYDFKVNDLITKLRLFKQSYFREAKDIKVDEIIKELHQRPYDPDPYKRLYRELSKFTDGPHWGNEADIAAFEKIFNMRFIICHQTGWIFTVPSTVTKPKFIAFLHFHINHYSLAGVYNYEEDDALTRKIFYTLDDIPHFLIQYL